VAGGHANHKDWDIKVNAVTLEEIVAGERKERHNFVERVERSTLKEKTNIFTNGVEITPVELPSLCQWWRGCACTL
jgi:hypothetical protein